jgi:glycerophosphoryl diester phosphodiesterase
MANPDTTRGPDGVFLSRRGPAIYSLTLEEVRRYDVGRLKPGTAYAAGLPEPRDGARIPTLEEVFELVRRMGAKHIRFNIETKLTPNSGSDVPDPELFAKTVAAVVRHAGFAEPSAYSHSIGERCSSCAKWIQTSYASA